MIHLWRKLARICFWRLSSLKRFQYRRREWLKHISLFICYPRRSWTPQRCSNNGTEIREIVSLQLYKATIRTIQVVYVARNPKDVMVSDYYHHKLVVKIHNFTGDFPLFARYFMKDMGIVNKVQIFFQVYKFNIIILQSGLLALFSSRSGCLV